LNILQLQIVLSDEHLFSKNLQNSKLNNDRVKIEVHNKFTIQFSPESIMASSADGESVVNGDNTLYFPPSRKRTNSTSVDLINDNDDYIHEDENEEEDEEEMEEEESVENDDLCNMHRPVPKLSKPSSSSSVASASAKATTGAKEPKPKKSKIVILEKESIQL
jgi:hypothetical protein